MPQQTIVQTRAGVSPVNTGIAQGYQNADFVGMELFPRVGVGERAGKIITFPREAFKQYSNMRRSPGGATPRVQVGYASGDYALVDYSIEGTLPKEIREEQLAPGKGFTINGAEMAINNAMDIIGLRLEIAQSTLATTLANYPSSNKVTLSGTAQFSDYSGTSDPVKVFADAKEAIRSQTGKQPRVAVMGPKVLAGLKNHPDIIERIKYTGRDVATIELLASLLDIPRIVVGEAITDDDAGVSSDVWGKHIVLAYTEIGTLADRGRPTYGYTYNLNGYPMGETAYYEDNIKTWCFPVSSCEQSVIAANTAGYLIYNAVA
jgi:hypothetical protein